GLDIRWLPNRNTAYAVTGSVGDAGGGVAVSGTAFPDPRSLTFDCANGVAYGNVPSVNAQRQRSSALRASVERSGRRGRLALTAWTARLLGAPVLTALDASASGVPPAYLGAVGAFASSPWVCGSPAIGSLAFTSFQPADQLNRGITAAGTLEFGKALLAGFATVQSRFVTDGTAATAALSPVGAQVPGTPLHRAGLVATVKLGKSVDALANVSYTAANNPNRLPAYTVFNAGFAAPLREGSLALVGTNLGNAHPGPFVSSGDVFALPRAGAAPLALVGTPLPPRAVALTYTVRVGRLGSQGSGAAAAEATPDADDPHGGVELRIRARPLRDGLPSDALQIDPDNEACTPVASRIAQPMMDAMGRIAASAEKAKAQGRYPATLADGTATVSGVVLTYTPYDNGARYVVVAKAPDLRSGAAFMNCAHLGIVQEGDREKFHLYVPEGSEAGRFFIAYSPSVGVYFAPPSQPGRGATMLRVTTDPEPVSPPANPYVLRESPGCPIGSKPVANAIVAAVQAARTAQRAGTAAPPVELADIVARGAAASGWLEIKPADPLAQAAILQCLHVASVPPDHLKSAGVEETRKGGALGFSDRFGFYVIARPDGSAPAPPPGHP
ncbi:MAG: hypothetical protein QOD51_1284, partial [Candidatus Eremiobacteraeota bacterium]|nr:hypothetical protein [Candidatus Eremiobacteraeota bacterium]